MKRNHVIIVRGQQHMCRLEEVCIVFYEGQLQRSRYLVKRLMHGLVDCVIGGYTHTELYFRATVTPPIEGKKEVAIGCSMERESGLTMTVRAYESDLWRFFPLPMTQAQVEALYEVCMRDVESELPFNARGFLCNFVVPHALRYDANGTAAFCSEHVLRSLRRARFDAFYELEPYETHPQMLFSYLESRGVLNARRARPGANLNEITV